LTDQLQAWATALFGEGALADLETSRLAFIDVPSAKPRFWKIAPGQGGRLWTNMLQDDLIAVGWDQLKLDLSQVASKEEIEKRHRETWGSAKPRGALVDATQLWNFAREIQPGDVVIANQGKSRILGRGIVVGPYAYRPERSEYHHTLPVRWVDTMARDVSDQGGSWVQTVREVTEANYRALFPEMENVPLAVKPRVRIYDFLRTAGFHFPDELVTTYLLSLITKPFVILSGISGTGKTKLAQLVAEWAGSEEREVEQESPVVEQRGDTWLYRLQPYNFRHRKIVLSREYEDQFELPSEEVNRSALSLTTRRTSAL
jgi:5-methylcytosine-specific restriction enzyme B